mgnify:FL=1
MRAQNHRKHHVEEIWSPVGGDVTEREEQRDTSFFVQPVVAANGSSSGSSLLWAGVMFASGGHTHDYRSLREAHYV